MVLVDTSVWIGHFRTGSPRLEQLLLDGSVLCHPFIIGELACGQLRNRKGIIGLLQTLPKAQIAEEDEVLGLIESKRLFGSGIGLIDAHLLASALLTRAHLLTEDAKLHKAAARLNLLYKP